MESIITKAIQSAQLSEIAFTKYITANDTGTTGGHQAGFHIHKNSWSLFTDTPGIKGSNESKFIRIRWQDEFETTSRFIYYGVRTRNEYRLTRFGKGFPFLKEDNVGDLLIISKKTTDFYEAFVLQSDEDIDTFFASLNISSGDTNGIIPKPLSQTPESKLMECYFSFLNSLKINFPTTFDLASNARNCFNAAYGISIKVIRQNPDKELLNWLKSEFELFKVIENDRYCNLIKSPFKNVEELIILANTILNRRKSRAGKSLEHHLSEIFNTFEITYSAQAVTEDYKKPDFLFPNAEAYYNERFNTDNLIMLASKTTCKDRWRQILNEADRIKTKHLFTLQQGISINQLEEMYKNNVCLVVPKPYLESFPKQFRSRIQTLNEFVNLVISKQS